MSRSAPWSSPDACESRSGTPTRRRSSTAARTRATPARASPASRTSTSSSVSDWSSASRRSSRSSPARSSRSAASPASPTCGRAGLAAAVELDPSLLAEHRSRRGHRRCRASARRHHPRCCEVSRSDLAAVRRHRGRARADRGAVSCGASRGRRHGRRMKRLFAIGSPPCPHPRLRHRRPLPRPLGARRHRRRTRRRDLSVGAKVGLDDRHADPPVHRAAGLHDAAARPTARSPSARGASRAGRRAAE